MLAFLGRLLSWIGQLFAALSVGLAIYIVIHPAVAAPYGRVIGVFTLLLVAACAWLIGRVAGYVSEK